MSKYINADELLKKLPDDLPYKGSVRRVLMQAPGVDVFAEIEEGIKAAVAALAFENNPVHRMVKRETYSSMMRFIKIIEEKYTEVENEV